jgi:hypothetical protein
MVVALRARLPVELNLEAIREKVDVGIHLDVESTAV